MRTGQYQKHAVDAGHIHGLVNYQKNTTTQASIDITFLIKLTVTDSAKTKVTTNIRPYIVKNFPYLTSDALWFDKKSNRIQYEPTTCNK